MKTKIYLCVEYLFEYFLRQSSKNLRKIGQNTKIGPQDHYLTIAQFTNLLHVLQGMVLDSGT